MREAEVFPQPGGPKNSRFGGLEVTSSGFKRSITLGRPNSSSSFLGRNRSERSSSRIDRVRFPVIVEVGQEAGLGFSNWKNRPCFGGPFESLTGHPQRLPEAVLQVRNLPVQFFEL